MNKIRTIGVSNGEAKLKDKFSIGNTFVFVFVFVSTMGRTSLRCQYLAIIGGVCTKDCSGMSWMGFCLGGGGGISPQEPLQLVVRV